MHKYLLTIMGLFFLPGINAQTFYANAVIDYPVENKTLQLNVANCDTPKIYTCLPTNNISQFYENVYYDMAIDTNQNIYYVSPRGSLYIRNLNDTSSCQFLGTFGLSGNNINALEVDVDGNVFAAGNLGSSTDGCALYKYNPQTHSFITIGNFPPNILSGGDLFFYEGKLFLIANDSYDNSSTSFLVEVNVSNPSQSCRYMDLPIGVPWGGFSIKYSSYSKAYVIVVSIVGSSFISTLFELDMTSNTISQPICVYPYPILGCASIYNFVPSIIDSNSCATLPTENCNNNTDDDNNGLTDQDDFACYFGPSNPSPCNQSPIIWGCSAAGGLYWVNLATGIETVVGDTNGNTNNYFGDLTWASDGKLYGLGGGDPSGIWEIDPGTAATKFKGALPDGYLPVNAMTADGSGNLYLTASLPSTTYIIKLNIATWQACIIADLTAANLGSGGDLTFLNGNLYLAVGNNVIAKVDVRTGVLQPITVINPIIDAYGLTTIGDGYLYASQVNKIYRIDPQTMEVSTSPSYVSGYPDLIWYGLTTYSETCHAPQCTAKISIHPSAAPPYCRNTGVRLQANTACNAGPGTFTWTTPSGDRVHADTLMAMTPGMYFVRYHNPPDTCSAIDSFLLQYECPKKMIINASAAPPYCRNIGVRLDANIITCNAGPGAFTWTTPSGGTVQSGTLTAMSEGMYFVKYQTLPDTCSLMDSFFLKYASMPFISIGNDTSLCAGEQLYLSLIDTTGLTTHRWQDGSTGTGLLSTTPGWYWLEVNTICGFVRGSIHIQLRTNGCETTVFVPTAFTPNGDGQNEVFKPVVSRTLSYYEFSIFNRWGQMVFKSRDINRGWDGSVSGRKQNTGVFTWFCHYQFRGKEIEQKKGTVVLIR